jgi:hypothetical protein
MIGDAQVKYGTGGSDVGLRRSTGNCGALLTTLVPENVMLGTLQ